MYYSSTNRPALVAANYGILVESFSGYALARDGESVTPFLVPALDGTGPTNGAFRCWFNRSAQSGNARLIEMIVVQNGTVTVNFSLHWNEDGSAICLDTAAAGGAARLLEAKAGWNLGDWHPLTLNHGSVIELFLDRCSNFFIDRHPEFLIEEAA
jgi:hypothetical protein